MVFFDSTCGPSFNRYFEACFTRLLTKSILIRNCFYRVNQFYALLLFNDSVFYHHICFLITVQDYCRFQKASVVSALADAQISGKTFQELFGDRKRKKKNPILAIKAKPARPAITFEVQPPGEFNVDDHLPTPREMPEMEDRLNNSFESQVGSARGAPVPSPRIQTESELAPIVDQQTPKSSRKSQRSSNHFNFNPNSNLLSVSPRSSVQINDENQLPMARVLTKPEIVKTGPDSSEPKPVDHQSDSAINTARVKLFSDRSRLSPLLEIKQLETGRSMEESFNLGSSRSLGELGGNDVPTVDDLLGDINLSIEHTYRELCDSGVLDDGKLKMFKPKQPKQRITTTKFTKADVGIVDPETSEGEHEKTGTDNENEAQNVSSETNVSAVPEGSENAEEKAKALQEETEVSGIKNANQSEISQKALPMDIQEFLIKQLPEGDVRCFAPSRSQLHSKTMYQSLPAKPSKTMRVYLCSTGDDMKYEKETILYGSIPEVQAYCKSKGLDLQVVDLSDSYIDNSYMFDPELINVRVSELKHCIDNSFAVSSIFLVGEKYGYTPLPRIILKNDLEVLLRFMESYEDKQLVFLVYELDYNSDPVTYVFEDENVFTVFKDSLPQEQSMKMNKFDLQKLVHKTLTTAFQLAAEKAYAEKAFTTEQKMKYFMSG